MATTITMPESDLRDLVARVGGLEQRLRNAKSVAPAALFEGDGTTKAFTLKAGHAPWLVTLAGAVVAEGALEAYTVTTDADRAGVVTFTTAPTNGAKIVVYAMTKGI